MTKKKAEYQNVRLKVETKKKLEAFGRMGESYDQLIERLLRDIDKVNFEIISVDGTPPAEHTVVYVIGNAKYRFSKGVYELIAVP